MTASKAQMDCPTCNATGVLREDTCPACDGYGHHDSSEKDETMTAPKGWVVKRQLGDVGVAAARDDGRAYVRYEGISYAAYVLGKREGGFRNDLQAMRWADRKLRVADKGKP